MLHNKQPNDTVGRPSAEQAEVARLTKELESTRRRLVKTESALEIMGKVHALLEDISESVGTEHKPPRR